MSLSIWSRVAQVEPSWVREYFFILYREFKDKPFTAEEAQRTFFKAGRSLENVFKVLGPLQRAGLVQEAGRLPDGKALYRILLREDDVKAPNKDEVFRLLKSAADVIRTAVRYESILLLLFYKVVSDKWESIALEEMSKGYVQEEAYVLTNNIYIRLYDEKEDRLYTWREVMRSGEYIAEMEGAISKVAELNSGRAGGINLEEIKGLVTRVGLSELARKDDLRPILIELVNLFNRFDFSQVDYDIIGDAYQWILAYFAPTKAKEGETYTPREVVRLMVRLMDPEDGSAIVDPACGSASMLIESYKYIREKVGGEEPVVKLIGQDRNGEMVAIAKMNLLLHNIRADAYVHHGDSLINPGFLNDVAVEEAVYAIANPPWNQDGYGEEKLSRPELKKVYNYGYPPNDKADWAWIQLLLHTATKKAVVVIDQGALFRGGREREIRSKIVDEDLVEAVILLPEKLFYNTQAPGVVIVFNKNKPAERKGKILFINANNEYESHPEIRKLNRLGEGHIERIVKAYREFRNIEGFTRVASLEEVRANDYNLSVNLYIAPPIEAGEVDIEKELQELLELEKQAEEAMKKVLYYIQQVVQANKG